jgi:circadian clock protein KaiB
MGKRRDDGAPLDQREAFEKAVEHLEDEAYLLRLFVTGTTPKSMRAIANIKSICEEHLKGRYQLEIIDLYKCPKLAKGERIVAVPTLVKQLPAPIRKLVGELSDREKVLFGLDITARP